MDEIRVERLKKALVAEGLAALVLQLPESIVMCGGTWPLCGVSSMVFTAADGPVALIAPSSEEEELDDFWGLEVRIYPWPRLDGSDPRSALEEHLPDLAQQYGFSSGTLGYEGSFSSVAPSHNAGECSVPTEESLAHLRSLLPRARWLDATPLLHDQRARKTEAEIARLRVAHAVANAGLIRFHERVEPGVSEAALAASVFEACVIGAAELPGRCRHVNVFPQISSGDNAHRAWRPIVSTGGRRLMDGEIALLELAVCVDGFWADVTRVKAAGRTSRVQRDAFAAVKESQAAAVKAVKPGVPAEEVHHIATRILIDAGFEKQVVHLTGHGLGFRYHEPVPMLMPGNREPLESGHVCSVEPGLYDPLWGGIRLEDNVVVGEEGCEVLTTAPKVL